VPSVAELESRGATIGRIDVHVQNIFDLSDPREDRPLYRLADHLHYPTRQRIVREQLLFAVGERVSAQKFAETERILRTRVYLNDAWIAPASYDAASNAAGIAVTVRDVWTLNPGISLGRSGGSNRSRLQLEDQDLLGLGTQVSVSRSHDVDRTSTAVSYVDPNLHGSWWQLALDYADNSDGKVKAIDMERPFYSLTTHTALGGALFDGTSVVPRYSRGQVVDQFEEHLNKHQAYFGWSDGLVNGWTRRWIAGVRYESAVFNRRADLAPQPLQLPADRRFAYPWLGWQIVEDHYVTSENMDLIGRTEDLYLGRSLYLELGYSPAAFGSLAPAVLGRANALAGWQFDPQRELFLASTFVGRFEHGAARNLSVIGGARYFYRVSARQLLYASLSGTASHALDAEQQVLLGGDSGLRGYPLRFQGGSSSALLTLEYRVFTDWFPFRLLRVGGAAFFDAGRTWGQDLTGATPLGLLKDVGVGLRFGNVRSGLGNVLHVDFSYALDAPLGVKKYQVTVETKQRF
jgi:hypothetical protein